MPKAFDKLAEKVARQYEKKGIKPATAEKWGRATVVKVKHEQEVKHDGGD